MIGLDTNVLVRVLTNDDARQSALATNFIAKQFAGGSSAYVNLIVLTELVWVLESSYAYTREQVAGALEALLTTAELIVESASPVWSALAEYREGADFADALIASVNEHHGCARTATFDSRAIKQSQHFCGISA